MRGRTNALYDHSLRQSYSLTIALRVLIYGATYILVFVWCGRLLDFALYEPLWFSIDVFVVELLASFVFHVRHVRCMLTWSLNSLVFAFDLYSLNRVLCTFSCFVSLCCALELGC